MKPLKMGNKIKVVPILTKVPLEKHECELVWRLIYNARGELLEKYGQTEFTDEMGRLMEKFSFPDSYEIDKSQIDNMK